MNGSKGIRMFVAGVVLAAAPLAATQAADAPGEPGKVVVTILHAAPGKQLELLKWLAAREAVDKEAGLAATQVYAHVDGDSWDFVTIGPDLSDADSDRVDELAKKKGLKVGFPAGLEFRQLVSQHTDTYARGPTTAADMVKLAGGK